MERRASVTRLGIGGLLAIVFLVACSCAFSVTEAYAGNLTTGRVVSSLDAPSVSSVVSLGAKKATITLGGLYSDIDGNEFQAALDKKFKKGLKKKSTTKSEFTFKTLRPGKKYYVRARSYINYNGVKYLTPWSAVKAVKVCVKASSAAYLGSWKLVKSTSSSDMSVINHNKMYFPSKHYVVKFNKNGWMSETNYNGSVSKIQWVATSKKTGKFKYNGVTAGWIKLKGNQLVVNNTKVTWTLMRI